MKLLGSDPGVHGSWHLPELCVRLVEDPHWISRAVPSLPCYTTLHAPSSMWRACTLGMFCFVFWLLGALCHPPLASAASAHAHLGPAVRTCTCAYLYVCRYNICMRIPSSSSNASLSGQGHRFLWLVASCDRLGNNLCDPNSTCLFFF